MSEAQDPAPRRKAVTKTVVMDDPDNGVVEAKPRIDPPRIDPPRDVGDAVFGDSAARAAAAARRSDLATRVEPTSRAAHADANSPDAASSHDENADAATAPSVGEASPLVSDTAPDLPATSPDKPPPMKTEMGEPPLIDYPPPVAGFAPAPYASYPQAYPAPPPYAPYPAPPPPRYPAYPARRSNTGVVLAAAGLVTLLVIIAGTIGAVFLLNDRGGAEDDTEPLAISADVPQGPAVVHPDTPTDPTASAGETAEASGPTTTSAPRSTTTSDAAPTSSPTPNPTTTPTARPTATPTARPTSTTTPRPTSTTTPRPTSTTPKRRPARDRSRSREPGVTI